MLHLIVRWANRRAALIVAGALLVAAVAGVFGAPVAATLSGGSGDFVTPGSDSARAGAEIARATGWDSDGGIVALVRLPATVDAPESHARVAAIADVLRSPPGVARVVTYYESRDPSMVSRDRRQTYLLAQLKRATHAGGAVRDLQDRLRGVSDVSLGGSPVVDSQVTSTVQADLSRAELLAFPVLFVLSLWIFRSLVASALPLVIGGLNVVVTLLGLRLIAHFVGLSIFALNLVTALGLGLAIDYSLLIVSRFRAELAQPGADVSGAVERTVLTAGRTIVFSSLTVAAALATLLMFPQRFLYSMAIGGTLVALLSATVALWVLPAVLALLGRRIDWLAPRGRALERDATSRRWSAMARRVTARPVLVATVTTALLIALGLPFLGVRFTFISAADLPGEVSGRQVDDALRTDFTANPLDAVQVVVIPPAGDVAAVTDVRAHLQRLPEVRAVAPAQQLDATTWLIGVTPRDGVFADASRVLVGQIRALPGGDVISVGGQTARFVDLRASLAATLEWAALVILLANVAVLMLMTGSVVLPLKSVLMNLLSLTATFGILVLIFQDGHLSALLGTAAQGALESTQPVLLFALVFGLSTDYGVFLLAGIKEARDGGATDREAVVIGLGRTARIVTAAALLFCVALGALATSRIVFIKELGIGTALGVLIDATIVRAMLVPALMALLGPVNWWGPAWLRRLNARVGENRPSSAAQRPVGARLGATATAYDRSLGGRHRATSSRGEPGRSGPPQSRPQPRSDARGRHRADAGRGSP